MYRFAFIAVACAFMFVSLPLFYYVRKTKLANTGETNSTAGGEGETRRAAFASVYNQAGSGEQQQSSAPPPYADQSNQVATTTNKDGYATFG